MKQKKYQINYNIGIHLMYFIQFYLTLVSIWVLNILMVIFCHLIKVLTISEHHFVHFYSV